MVEDMVEIQFDPCSLKWQAGQWLFLRARWVSKLEWHPFPITSCPFDPYISVHVPQVPGFNRSLGNGLGAGHAQARLYDSIINPRDQYEIALQNGQEMPILHINGPYNVLPMKIFEDEIAILIADGIGLTALASILKHLWHLRNMGLRPVGFGMRHVEIFWICEDIESFGWFERLFSALETQNDGTKRIPEVQTHIHLTQNFDANAIINITLNSPSTGADPLTGLKTPTKFGRPNFRSAFTTVRDGTLDGTYLKSAERKHEVTIGVYFCGSSAAGTSGMLGTF